jgi:hypothetical protein
MSDPRVIEALTDALGIHSTVDLAVLRRLGTASLKNAEEIKVVAKRALIQLENAEDRYPVDVRNQAAQLLKQWARDLIKEAGESPKSLSGASKTGEAVVSETEKTTAASPPPKPKLVARPVDPARVAAVAAPMVLPTPMVAAADETPSEPIELVPKNAKFRRRGTSKPWLGWALLGLLVLVSTAVIAVVSLNGDTLLTFQAPPKPSPSSEPDRGKLPVDKNAVDRNASPSDDKTPPADDKSQGEQPSPLPNVDSPPSVSEQEATENPPTSTENPPTSTDPIGPAPPTEPSAEDNRTGVPVPNPNVSASDPTSNNPELDEAPKAATTAQRIAILRQLELSLLAIAAGKDEMSVQCLQRAKQASVDTTELREAITLVEQLIEWRNEINSTVAARVPLLTNREELPVDDTIVSLISVDEQTLVIRAAGQRVEYPANKLPWSIARSVLEVTNSDNAAEDEARQLVTDILRQYEATERTKGWATQLKGMTDSGIQSPVYATEALTRLVAYLEVDTDFQRFCPPSEPPQRLTAADWAPWYRETASMLKSNREWRAQTQDLSSSRFELEDIFWDPSDLTNSESVAKTLLTIQHAASERHDLPGFLDNLLRLQQLLIIPSEHNLWSDLGRALVQTKPADADLLKWLEQLKTATESGDFSPPVVDGLAKVGKQLAQRLTDRTQKQEWTRKF